MASMALPVVQRWKASFLNNARRFISVYEKREENSSILELWVKLFFSPLAVLAMVQFQLHQNSCFIVFDTPETGVQMGKSFLMVYRYSHSF